jgi:hypothetical protein
MADDDQDPLQPGGEQGPDGPLDQAQATQAEQDLGGTAGDRFQPLDRPAASTTPTCGGSRDGGGVGWTASARWGNAVNGSGGSCGASAMRRLPEEQPG